MLNRIGRAMSRVALEQLDVRPGDQVLEVGFGGGELIEALLAAGAEVTGVDISDAMVTRALRRFRQAAAAGRARFLLGSADLLPLDRCAVDKACSVNAIYFWKDAGAVMREFARVIRPGGNLVLCFQTPEAVQSWPGHRHSFIAYDEAEVADFMRAAGFRLLGSEAGSGRHVGEFVCMKAERS